MYSQFADNILYEEDIRKLYFKTNKSEVRCLISLLWITACKPEEARLKREDFIVNDNFLQIRFWDRTLLFQRTTGEQTNLFLETIIQHVLRVPKGRMVFKFSSYWMRNVIKRLGQSLGKTVCCYDLRDSSLVWHTFNGASKKQLMLMKSVNTLRSVSGYIRSIPVLVELMNRRREINQQVMMKENGGLPKLKEIIEMKKSPVV